MSTQQLILLGLQASIFLVVFGYGLRTSPADVGYVVHRPSLLARSLIAMFVVMPVIAVALGKLFTLEHPVEIALVTLAISPVPPLLPRREGKAGGHSAYGMGLFVVAALSAIVIVPLGAALLGRFLGHDYAMSAASIARIVGTMIVLPLAAGMVIRSLAPHFAARIAKPAGIFSFVILALGVVAILIAVLPTAVKLVGNGTLLTLAIFVAAGLFVGHRLAGDPAEHRTVLALSTASRHPAIALAIAKANFPDEPRVGAAILLYLLVSFLISFPYVLRRKRAAAAAASSHASQEREEDDADHSAVVN